MKKIICIVLLICCPVLSGAQQGTFKNQNQLVPTYHWIYDYLIELKLRGYLGDLNLSVRPFSVGEITREIQDLADSVQKNEADYDPAAVILIRHLKLSFLLKTGSGSTKAKFNTQLFLKTH